MGETVRSGERERDSVRVVIGKRERGRESSRERMGESVGEREREPKYEVQAHEVLQAHYNSLQHITTHCNTL